MLFQVEELILDDAYKTKSITVIDKNLLETYTNTKHFSLNFCNLASLSNLPEFQDLTTVFKYYINKL